MTKTALMPNPSDVQTTKRCKLNLCYDGRIFLGCSKTGIFYTALNIYKTLKTKDVNMYVYIPQGQNIDKDIYRTYLSKERFLNEKSDFSNIDVYFSPNFAVPNFIKRYPNISVYTLVHDTIPILLPQYFPSNAYIWFMKQINVLNKSDFYFANSEYTKSDFLKYCPNIDPEKIDVALIATNLDYKPHKNHIQLQKAKAKYNLPSDKKYLFSLCSLEPRKNLIRAVKTFLQFIEKNKIDDLIFVLGGSAWAGFIEKFEREVPDDAKYKDKIICVGRVDDEDLEILYSNAEWFVYTSQYEGFGMPPLEAMACGCAVISSNNSSLPEVVGDAGQMIDWDSDEQHIKAYEKYYFDKKFRDKMAQKGLARSKQFSWDKCVDIIMKRIEDTQARKSQKPLVTIITTTYNLIDNGRKEWFIQNMESVRNQTYDNVEHLVIDRVSTDGTVELLKEYQKKGWIRYISKPDNGIYDAINKGILNAKGKYVVCLNSNDFYCDNHALEWLVSKAEEQQADAVSGGAQLINSQNRIISTNYDMPNLILGNTICSQTFLIKRDVIKELELYNSALNMSADMGFMFRMLQHNKNVKSISNILVSSRLDDNISPDMRAKIRREEQIQSLFEEYGQYHYLSYYDCMLLLDKQFLSLPLEDAIKLGAKLEKPEWVGEYFRRLFAHYKVPQQKTRIVQPKKLSIKLFGFIPIYKKKQKEQGQKLKQKFWILGLPFMKKTIKPQKISYKLFFFLPVLKIIEKPQKKKWKILGLPLFKKKTKSDGRKTKYYFCGIPCFKVMRKTN